MLCAQGIWSDCRSRPNVSRSAIWRKKEKTLLLLFSFPLLFFSRLLLSFTYDPLSCSCIMRTADLVSLSSSRHAMPLMLLVHAKGEKAQRHERHVPACVSVCVCARVCLAAGIKARDSSLLLSPSAFFSPLLLLLLSSLSLSLSSLCFCLCSGLSLVSRTSTSYS